MAASGDGSPFELFSSVRYDVALRAVAGKQEFKHAGWNYQHVSPYYMLDFHRDRLLRAATHWGWDAAATIVLGGDGLRRLEQVLDDAINIGATSPEQLNKPKRCRITLGQDGRLGAEVASTPPASLSGLLPLQFPLPGFMLEADSPVSSQPDTDVPTLMKDLRSVMGKAPYDVTVDADTTSPSPYTHYKTTRRQMYDAARQRAGITGPEPKEVLLVSAKNGVVMDGSISTVYFWRQGRWVTPPVPSKYVEASGSGGLDGTTRRWAIERYVKFQAYICLCVMFRIL